jgi:hypothetical protein
MQMLKKSLKNINYTNFMNQSKNLKSFFAVEARDQEKVLNVKSWENNTNSIIYAQEIYLGKKQNLDPKEVTQFNSVLIRKNWFLVKLL